MSAPVSETVAGVSFVILRGGLTVPVDALRLSWALEGRGLVLTLDGDALVVDGPRGALLEADRAAIRRWREHLKAIAGYRAPEVVA